MKSKLLWAATWLALSLFSTNALAVKCDVDDDGDIDLVDINLIFADRGEAATGPDDPRDVDNNGFVSVRDGRLCQRQCTLPRCASPAANQTPVADAGPDQNQPVGSLVTLDGSGSSDADGDPLTYSWSLTSIPAGSSATLDDPAAVMPTFSMDLTGDYTAELTVNDGTIDSVADTVLITTANTPPIADAGPDQSGEVFDSITLDGSGSSDANNDALTFAWSFVSMPAGSSATLDDNSAIMPSFSIDVSGDYSLQLIVNDGTADSAADTVMVTTDNSVPVADAGPDQSARVNDTVTLDGSGSSDVNGDPLTYAWSLLNVPAGSTASLSDNSAINPTFDVDVAGTYVAQLIVNDGSVDSLADTVTISTDNTAPVADAGPDASAQISDTVTLDGSASSDIDGDPLTFDWSIVSQPAGSTASLSDNSAVMPTFVLDVTGDYTFQLVVNDGITDSAADTVTISTDNTAPVADAGPDQTPFVGDTATLDGSGSSDANGDPLSFAWSLINSPAGSSASLSDSTAVSPTLDIDEAGTYELELVVNDGQTDSAADTVMLITANSAPVADAGADQSALVGQTVTLDGTASTDVDGDPLSYAWSISSQPAGSTSSLSDPTASMPTLLIDVTGTYQVQLIVNDGTLDSAPDSTVISTSNTPPVADAGPDQTPFVNDIVTLDGSASSDVDGNPLTYVWALTSQPAGSSASLNDNTAVMPQFTVDLPGNYVAQLTVNDGTVDSAPDTVSVNTQNSAPVSDAGPDQAVALNDTVTLDGSASSDVDGNPLTYVWSLTDRPAGSVAALSDPNVVGPTFDVDQAGSYTAQLIVNDGTVDSAPDTVVVSTTNTRPVADAGPDQTPDVGSTATLDGSASNDADSDPITYSWSLISAPAGSAAALSTPTAVSTDINIDLPGTYVVQLIVNDGTIDSFADTVTLITANRPPIADAGADQSVSVSQAATFDGTASSDPDGNPLTYAWSITSAPAGSTAALSSTTSPTPDLTPDLEGSYTLQLIVNDGNVDSAPDTVDLTATAALQTLTVALDSPRVGVARTISGTVTLGLPAPAGGVTVNLTSSQTGIATVNPASIFIPEAVTNGTFDINGVAEGTSVITASATGYADDTANILVTSALITLGDPGDIAPDQTVSIAVSISTPAPAGGLTVNLASSAPSIVSVTPSVFIPEGLQVPAANPQVTGDQIGTATITATSDLFAPDTRDIDVTLTVSFNPNPLSLPENSTVPVTVNLSAPAPTGGLTLTLVSADTGIANVPASVVIPQGQLSSPLDVTGIAIGSTTVTASSNGIPDSQLSVDVSTAPPINLGSAITVGRDLQTARAGTVGQAAPAGNLQVTLTSSDPSRLLLANNSTDAGTASVQVQVNAGGIGIPSFFIHALEGTGSEVITATAPGYANGSLTVNLVPSGFIINSPGNFSTTVFANNTNIQIRPYRLNPTTLAIQQIQSIRGGLSVDVPVTSSDTAVGTVTNSPLTFTGNISALNGSFDPLTAGTTTIAVTQPAGFSTPNNFQSIEATVTAPNINIANVTVGEDLQATVNISLQSAPPVPTDVTITVANAANAIISSSATTVGTNTVTFTGVTGTFVGSLIVQGLAVGDTTLSASANGYSNGSSNVTVTPSGFIINSPGNFSTTTFANNTNIQLRPYRLNPTTLAIQQIQNLRAGVNVDLTVSSSDTNTGVITVAPVNMAENTSAVSTQFDPINAGSTQLTIVTPTGFDTPNNFQSIDVTVTAPNINMNNVNVGEHLQTAISVSLQSTPPGPVDVTITTDDPTVAIMSDNATTVGTNSITFSGVTGTFVGTITIQGLSQGVATLTATAAGYNTDTSTVTVTPSGFIINSPGSFSTTSFSNNTNVQIRPYRLNPTTLAIQQIQAVRAGLSVDVPVTSSDTNVGVITTSPVNFAANVSAVNTSFDPVAAGTSTIAVTQPAGFATPSAFQSITATVNAPNVIIGNVTVGKDLQVGVNISLQAAPPSPVDVIISSTAPGIAIISDNATSVGANQITISGVTNTFVATVYVQGLATGGTSVVASAAGYNDGNSTVTVTPAGFIVNSPSNFSVGAGDANRNIQIRPYRLNPTTLNIVQIQAVRGGLSVDVEVTSSAPAVGVITTSPLTFPGNNSLQNTQFDPIAAGTSQITVVPPSGFSTPSNFQSITATVTP